MKNFIVILIFIAVIFFTLIIHEFGHYITGKIFKVNIREYSIGVGPKICSFKTKSKMRISWRIFPVAAYVMLDSSELRSIYKNEVSVKAAIINSPVPAGKFLINDLAAYKKIIIYTAGIFFNLLVFFIMYIISIIVNENILNFNIILVNWFKSLAMILTFQSGEGASIFAGSVRIATETIHLTYWSIFLNYIIVINLTLLIFNIFPIPPLDGFKVVLFVIEKINGKPISEKTNYILSIISSSILLYFIIAIIVSDIRSYV